MRVLLKIHGTSFPLVTLRMRGFFFIQKSLCGLLFEYASFVPIAQTRKESDPQHENRKIVGFARHITVGNCDACQYHEEKALNGCEKEL